MTASPSLWTDAAVLRALDLIDNEGLASREAARVLSRELRAPVSRNAVIGVVNRVRVDDAKIRDDCCKAGNRDGGQARFWWRNGRGE